MAILGCLLLAALVLGAVAAVRAVRKKPARALCLAALAAFVAGLALLAVIGGGFASFWVLLSPVALLAALVSAVQAVVQRLRRQPSARYAWRVLLFALAAIGLLLGSQALCDFTQMFGIVLLLAGVPLLLALLVRLARIMPKK